MSRVVVGLSRSDNEPVSTHIRNRFRMGWMMLLQNGIRNGAGPQRFMGGANATVIERGKWATPGALRNLYAGEATVISGASIANKSAYPSGYAHPMTWVLPQKPGGATSRKRIIGVGAAVGAAAGGLNAVGPLSGCGDVTYAEATLIVSAIAALVGSGDITAAELNAVLPAIAALSGSGDVSGAVLQAIGELLSALAGTGSVTNTLTATGRLEAALSVTGETLSTANVAEAVWSALAEGNFSYAQCLQIIAAACGGKSSDTGQTFRDLSDTKDRIAGTVSAGDRTAVTYDLD